MKLSKRCEYALRTLIDLGLAFELGDRLVQARDLAEKENLPLKFLEQILIQLREAGYVESRRGKAGGYRLAMPAARIKIGQIVRLIDGPVAPVSCVSATAYARCGCPDEDHCGVRMLMLAVRNAIARTLDAFTLESTVKMVLRKIRRNKPLIPFVDSLRKPARTARKPRKSSTTAAKPTNSRPKRRSNPLKRKSRTTRA